VRGRLDAWRIGVRDRCDELRRAVRATLPERCGWPTLTVARADGNQYAIAHALQQRAATRCWCWSTAHAVHAAVFGRVLGSAGCGTGRRRRIEVITGPSTAMWAAMPSRA